MRRLQIMIDEDLDDALALQARAERTSKAALIRRYVRERLGRSRSGGDSLWTFAGTVDGEPADDIDEVVYGGRERDSP
jgi:hypothetical protein